jgi:hypothetical protein
MAVAQIMASAGVRLWLKKCRSMKKTAGSYNNVTDLMTQNIA